MILVAVVQHTMDNPHLDLLYFLVGVLIALVPTSILGTIGYFVIRDWYLHHYRRKAVPASGPGPGPVAR